MTNALPLSPRNFERTLSDSLQDLAGQPLSLPGLAVSAVTYTYDGILVALSDGSEWRLNATMTREPKPNPWLETL